MLGFFKRSKDGGERRTMASHMADSRDIKGRLDGAEDAFHSLTNEQKFSAVFQRGMDMTDVIDDVTLEPMGRVSAMDAYDGDASPWKVNGLAGHVGTGANAAQGVDTSVMVKSIQDDVWSHYMGETYIGWQACAMLAQNDIIHLACNIPAEDAIACGFRFSFADNKEDDADKDKDGHTDADELTDLVKETERLGITRACVKMTYNKRVFGTGVAIPVIKRGGKPLDMSRPFNTDGLRKGDEYIGFKVVDPYWLCPKFDLDSKTNPVSERYMQPTWYALPDGRLIHHTWFIKVDNVEPADILKPTYIYGGIPLTQQIYKRVWCAEKTANEAPLLAMSKRMLVVDADVEQIFKNREYVQRLMDTITRCRTNWGVFFKRPGTEMSQMDTTLTDFEECMMSQYQLVASIAQMPATKLLQTTPKGFNSTGEYEWKIYAQLLETLQATDYKPLIERHVEILTTIRGDRRKVTVVFNPVDAPTERERADIEATKANTRSTYVQNQILTADEVRNSLRNDMEGEFTGIPIENPELHEDNTEEVEGLLRKIEREDADAEKGGEEGEHDNRED